MIRRTVPTTEGGLYYFDADAADAGVAWWNARITLTVAEWAGKPFILDGLQLQTVRDVFGWKRTDDGTRRYRVLYIWVPRKWGKSEYAAGLGFLLLLGDDEPGAQVYCIATNEDQAKIIFDRAVAMVINDTPDRCEDEDDVSLSEACTPFATEIMYHDTASVLKFLTGKPKGKHGLMTSGILADECHEWDDDELYTFVHQAEGARRQPLDVFTSTAGKKEGVGWERFKLCEAILEGSIIAPDHYVVIASADPQKHKDDTGYWQTEEAWAEANPNYPITPKKSYLQAECNAAKGSPRLQNNFLRYHLNLWVEQDTRWLDLSRWDKCAHSDWRTMHERMRGRPCIAGDDLSAVQDLTASVLIFPPLPDDPWIETVAGDDSRMRVQLWRVLPRFFIPRARANDRVKLDKQPFDKWIKAGAVTATPGDVIDQNALHLLHCGDPERKPEPLLGDVDHYDLQAVMVDRWNATQYVLGLIDEGLQAELFGQGMASMSGPSKFLEKLVLTGALDHGGHPVLRWCAENVCVKEDAAENIKPDKEESGDRIDGIVGTVMAIGGCDLFLTGDPETWEIVPVNQT